MYVECFKCKRLLRTSYSSSTGQRIPEDAATYALPDLSSNLEAFCQKCNPFRLQNGMMLTAKAVGIGTAWQPFETAPKDGTWILTWRKGRIEHCHWRQREVLDYGFCWGGDGWEFAPWNMPTHWMPAPGSPHLEVGDME